MDEYSKELEKSARVAVDALKSELAGIRTNRPSPKLVEDIKVSYMERQFTVKQLGSISIVPPREIDINVWDPSALPAVAKAIETSGMGLTANTSGNLIRINLPTLTEERRQEIIKLVKKSTEETKIRLRALRDEANKKIDSAFKAKTISEDQKFKAREQVQKAVDKLNAEVETLLAGKIKEISE